MGSFVVAGEPSLLRLILDQPEIEAGSPTGNLGQRTF
jgi:hypothetical protein